MSYHIRCLLIVAILAVCVLANVRKTKDNKPTARYFHGLFNYFQGLQLGQSYGFQFPPLLIHTPIIIIPTYNQQSVIVQNRSTNENYEEAGIRQTIKPAKLQEHYEDSNSNDVIENNKRHTLKREIVKSNKTKVSNLREINNSSSSNISTTESSTTESSIKENITSTESATTSTTKDIKPTTIKMDVRNETITEAQMSSISIGLYPKANYDNGFINQIMLTTEPNDYNNLPSQDDERWRNFSTKNNFFKSISSGFRPLAGLYYDGFLHKNLIKKRGWFPF